jgi:hypothetical protein
MYKRLMQAPSEWRADKKNWAGAIQKVVAKKLPPLSRKACGKVSPIGKNTLFWSVKWPYCWQNTLFSTPEQVCFPSWDCDVFVLDINCVWIGFKSRVWMMCGSIFSKFVIYTISSINCGISF